MRTVQAVLLAAILVALSSIARDLHRLASTVHADQPRSMVSATVPTKAPQTVAERDAERQRWEDEQSRQWKVDMEHSLKQMQAESIHPAPAR